MATSTTTTKTTPPISLPQAPRKPKPWHAHVTLDLLADIANRSILHPFIACLIPLCLRAVGTPATWLRFQVAVEEELETKGIAYYRCDVGERKEVEEAYGRIEEDLGTPTILINNAGVVNGKPLLELSAADLERNFRINLLAHFNTIQTFLPGMLDAQNGGTIVTVSSVLGKVGAACLSDYTAAKAGLIAMHTSLQAELKQSKKPGAKNIRTILVAPGQLRTRLFGELETPSSFLAPIVEPVQVAQAIIRTVDAGEGGDISFPLYARWMEWMTVLPSGLQWIIRGLSGVDDAMNNFGVEKNKDA
ncbi:hypothetical protein SLS57_009909 [Botryosphaeria dothidea]